MIKECVHVQTCKHFPGEILGPQDVCFCFQLRRCVSAHQRGDMGLKVLSTSLCTRRLPREFRGKEPVRQCRRHERHRFSPWIGKMPWRRAWQPTPVFFPGESPGQRTWWAVVHRIAKSRTQLKRLSTQARNESRIGVMHPTVPILQRKKPSGTI